MRTDSNESRSSRQGRRAAQPSRSLSRERVSAGKSQNISGERASADDIHGAGRSRSSSRNSEALSRNRTSSTNSQMLSRNRSSAQNSQSFNRNQSASQSFVPDTRSRTSAQSASRIGRERVTLNANEYLNESELNQRRKGSQSTRATRKESKDRVRSANANEQRNRGNSRRRSIPKEAPGAEIVLNRVSKAEMTSPLFRKVFFVFVLAAIAALVIFVVIPFVNNVGNYEKNEPVVNETFDISRADMTGVPITKKLGTFSLTANLPPNLDDSQITTIENAVKEIESTGSEVGFVFYSTKTGYGISYNSKANVYGASSIKALYALYVCENFIETGEYSLDSYIRAGKVIDGSDGYVVGEEYNLRALLQDMIIKSSNNAFVILRTEFDDRGWNFWVDSLGCDELEKNSSYNFAWYSPASAITLWTEMYNYLSYEQTDTVKAMKEWLGQSYLSFIRNAIKSKGATAYAKAGWNKDDEPDWNSTCDNGIININGDTFVCSFMTSMPYDEIAKAKIENLVLQCFVCYSTLMASK